MLEIKVKRLREIVVVECAGRLCAGENLYRLREAALAEPVPAAVVLDLAKVTAIDAAGLGTLISLHTSALHLGSELKLCAPSAQVEAILALTRLDTVFTVCSAHESDGLHSHIKAASCA